MLSERLNFVKNNEFMAFIWVNNIIQLYLQNMVENRKQQSNMFFSLKKHKPFSAYALGCEDV